MKEYRGISCVTKVATAGEVLKLHYKEVSGSYHFFVYILCLILYYLFYLFALHPQKTYFFLCVDMNILITQF